MSDLDLAALRRRLDEALITCPTRFEEIELRRDVEALLDDYTELESDFGKVVCELDAARGKWGECENRLEALERVTSTWRAAWLREQEAAAQPAKPAGPKFELHQQVRPKNPMQTGVVINSWTVASDPGHGWWYTILSRDGYEHSFPEHGLEAVE